MAKGFIYIMTNPALKDMVKIGYAKDVEQRRQQLSTTALPYDYEVYATYETPGALEDKKLHKMIDTLNPDLRVSKNREFYIMTPEQAYELLEAIAAISGSQEKLMKVVPDNSSVASNETKTKNPPIDFFKCGIPDGAELVYIYDSNIRVTVCGNRKVLYNNELTSLTAVVKMIKNSQSVHIAGTSYFTYNGKLITDIARETQWKE